MYQTGSRADPFSLYTSRQVLYRKNAASSAAFSRQTFSIDLREHPVLTSVSPAQVWELGANMCRRASAASGNIRPVWFLSGICDEQISLIFCRPVCTGMQFVPKHCAKS